jgi:hypothetical protein
LNITVIYTNIGLDFFNFFEKGNTILPQRGKGLFVIVAGWTLGKHAKNINKTKLLIKQRRLKTILAG